MSRKWRKTEEEETGNRKGKEEEIKGE